MGREGDDDSIRAQIRGRSSFLPLHGAGEQLKPCPGCEGRGLLREAAQATQLALLLLDLAEHGSLHPGHGKSPAPASSPNLQKSCSGAVSRAPQLPRLPLAPRRTPMGTAPCSPHACLSPGRDGHAGTDPSPTTKQALKRDQQKPVAERLCPREPGRRGCLQQAELHAPVLEWGRPHRTMQRADTRLHRPLAPQTQPPPGTCPGPAEKFKGTRTKLPICFPAQESQTLFSSAPFPCARCCCRTRGDHTSPETAQTPALPDALKEPEGNVPFSQC